MSDKIKKIHKRLTLAELKNCKGFENYSDEQAEETIKSLEKLSILFYELYMKQKVNKQKVLSNNRTEKEEEENYERKPTHKKRSAA